MLVFSIVYSGLIFSPMFEGQKGHSTSSGCHDKCYDMIFDMIFDVSHKKRCNRTEKSALIKRISLGYIR